MNLTTLSDLTRAALALAEECGYSIEVEATDGTRQVLQRRHAQRTLVVLLADSPTSPPVQTATDTRDATNAPYGPTLFGA